MSIFTRVYVFAALLMVLCTACIITDPCIMEVAKQPAVGNLAVKLSQQPATLFGFGQHILEKGGMMGALAPDFLFGHGNRSFSEIYPYVVFGIQDNVSALIRMPVALRFTDGCSTTHGLEDTVIQLEYAPYIYTTSYSTTMVTLVGSVLLPFGNARKQPFTGFGSPSFFAGVTIHYLSTEWYWYVSPGIFFTTSRGNTKTGNRFWYQAGFGKNMGYESDVWTAALMLEMAGVCDQKNKICGVIDPTSGSNTIVLGPTVWFSTQRFIFQFGIAPVIYQELHTPGRRWRDILFIACNFEWKFA